MAAHTNETKLNGESGSFFVCIIPKDAKSLRVARGKKKDADKKKKWYNRDMRVSFEIDIKPISINAAFQGRRFKTAECKRFERDFALLLPHISDADGKEYQFKGEIIVSIHFYLVNYASTDVSNLVKILEDMLVKKGIIEDDRKVVELHLKKTKAKKHKIKISIRQA